MSSTNTGEKVEQVEPKRVNPRVLPPPSGATARAYRRTALHDGSPDWLPAEDET